MSSPHYSYQLGPFDFHVFGHQPHLSDDNGDSYQKAITLGATPGMVAQIVTASGPAELGHKQVYPANYHNILQADGIVLSDIGSAAIIRTADCAATLLYDALSGNGALVHMGRPALNPTLNECTQCGYTVIDNTLPLLTERGPTTSVHAVVTGNICGSCFTHEHPGAEKHTEYFKRLPGVFTDESVGALDLFEVIRYGLMHYDVPEANIEHVGPCTLETPELASDRRGDSTRNVFIAIKAR